VLFGHREIVGISKSIRAGIKTEKTIRFGNKWIPGKLICRKRKDPSIIPEKEKVRTQFIQALFSIDLI